MLSGEKGNLLGGEIMKELVLDFDNKGPIYVNNDVNIEANLNIKDDILIQKCRLYFYEILFLKRRLSAIIAINSLFVGLPRSF